MVDEKTWARRKKAHIQMKEKRRELRKDKVLNVAASIALYGSCPGWRREGDAIVNDRMQRTYPLSIDDLARVDMIVENFKVKKEEKKEPVSA